MKTSISVMSNNMPQISEKKRAHAAKRNTNNKIKSFLYMIFSCTLFLNQREKQYHGNLWNLNNHSNGMNIHTKINFFKPAITVKALQQINISVNNPGHHLSIYSTQSN